MLISSPIQSFHRYLSDVAHVDIWWYGGSQLDLAPKRLPELSVPLSGCSIVPYRYHFNTGESVCFSVDTASY